MTFFCYFFPLNFDNLTVAMRANCVSFHFMWKIQVDTENFKFHLYGWHKRLKGHKNRLTCTCLRRGEIFRPFSQSFLRRRKKSSAELEKQRRRVYLARVKIKTILIAHVSFHVFLLDPSSFSSSSLLLSCGFLSSFHSVPPNSILKIHRTAEKM